MIPEPIRAAAWESAKVHKVELNLVLAMIVVESSGNRFRTRFEKNWSYFKDIDIWAFKRQITENTERIMQMTSWGLMQVMGSVARELGFVGDLPELTDTRIGIEYGVKKIVNVQKKYSSATDIIAAYNAGRVVMENGRYKNQHHVDKVMAALYELSKEKT